MSCCFLGSMRCKSGSANKFKHHVSCVLPPSQPIISLQFKLHQERIKVCNPQPKNVLWEIILGVLEMPRAPQKSKWAAARTIQLAQKLETNSKTYKDRMLTIEGSLEANERNMGDIWRNKGKYERFGKPLQERARLNTILWDFSRREIILGVLEMPCTFSKNSCQNDPTRPKAGQKLKKSKTYKNRMLTIESSLEANERNIGDIWRNKGKYERFGKPLQERARLNTILWDFSRGEISLGVLEMPCTSQKTAARTTQLAQRLGKNSKTYKNRMLALSHSLPPFFLTRHERNMGEIGRSMKKIGNM